jgi:hypothetical protein
MSSQSDPIACPAAVSSHSFAAQFENFQVCLPALGYKIDQQTQHTYLFARHRVAHQRQIHQLLEPCERVQIGELSDAILGEDKRLQIRYA